MTSSPRVGDSGAGDSGPRVAVELLDPQIKSIQPGGGACMRIELAWGYVRRAVLKRLFPGYVRKMLALRQGDPSGCPHEVLDPRDLKYYRNQTTCHWDAQDDPYQWRQHLGFARVGLAELLLLVSSSAAAAIVLGWLWWPLALVPLLVCVEIFWFFRNPARRVPQEAGLVVAPADGTIVAIEELDHDDFIGGPAVMIGIFLSVFNVHINRVPVGCRVIGMTYRRGKFLNALRAASARENEQLAVRFEESLPPFRRLVVRQIAGAIARRIVCWVKPGEDLERGAQFGMIKLGSRTELVIPRDSGLAIRTQLGAKVLAGETVLAQYER